MYLYFYKEVSVTFGQLWTPERRAHAYFLTELICQAHLCNCLELHNFIFTENTSLNSFPA
jgi:hypothetical protein